MIELLIVLWPLFALIVMGFCMQRFVFPSEAFWPGAEKLNYFILFPALLISNLATAPLNDPEMFVLTSATLLVLAVGWGGVLLFRHYKGWPASRAGVFAQGALRFNTYLGLAAVGSLFGKEGLALAAVLLAIKVPLLNILSVWALSAERGISVRKLLLPVLKNPLIWSCLIGVLINLSGIRLSGGSEQFLYFLSSASLPLGLLCVGAGLRLQELVGEVSALGWNSFFRLICMPILALVVAYCLNLPTLQVSVLVIFFALPTAPSAFVLTRQLGGDGHLMAGLITLQTLLAVLTLPLVLYVLEKVLA